MRAENNDEISRIVNKIKDKDPDNVFPLEALFAEELRNKNFEKEIKRSAHSLC